MVGTGNLRHLVSRTCRVFSKLLYMLFPVPRTPFPPCLSFRINQSPVYSVLPWSRGSSLILRPGLVPLLCALTAPCASFHHRLVGVLYNYSLFPSAALDCQHLEGPRVCIPLFPVQVLIKCLLNKLLTNQVREGLPHLGIQGPRSSRVGQLPCNADLEALA